MTDEQVEVPTEPGWDYWGFVADREATVGVITALQSDGLKVKVVREGSLNRVFTQPRSS